MADFRVIGAGLVAANQAYTLAGLVAKKPSYRANGDRTWWVVYSPKIKSWVVTQNPTSGRRTDAPHAYSVKSGADAPPLDGWQVGGRGRAASPLIGILHPSAGSLMTGIL